MSRQQILTRMIGDSQVTSIKIADGAIVSADLAPGLSLAGTTGLQGNLQFTGASPRILAPLSTTPESTRLMFQNSDPGNPSTLGLLPGASSQNATLVAYAQPNPANASYVYMSALSTGVVQVGSGHTGTGAAAPVQLVVDGTPRWRLDTSGHFVPLTDAAQDIGVTSTNRVRNLFQSGYQQLATISTPTVPPAGSLDMYAKSDGLFYTLNSSGVERALGSVNWPLLAPDGTAAAPSYAFASEATLGLFRSAASQLGLNGSLVFAGSARRIMGDFSDATSANRLALQSSVTNGFTLVPILPNGTSRQAGIVALDTAGGVNSGYLGLYTDGTVASVDSGAVGTGTSLPIRFVVAGTERMRIATSGAVTIPGTLTVSGATTLSGTLAVTGAFTLSGGTINNHTVMSQQTGGIGTSGTSEGQLELQNAGSGASKIAFHRTGAFAAYLGLDTDNQWAVGGWSMGAVRYVLITDNQTQTLTNKTLDYNSTHHSNAAQMGGASIDLGQANSAANLNRIKYVKAWSGTLTVYTSGANGVVFGTSTYGSGSLILQNGDSLTLFANGDNWWWVV